MKRVAIFILMLLYFATGIAAGSALVDDPGIGAILGFLLSVALAGSLYVLWGMADHLAGGSK